jgi:hypothetical protein
VAYVPPSQAIPLQEHLVTNGTNGHHLPARDPYQDLIKDHIDKAERQKEDRRKQNLALEQRRVEDQENELELKRLSETQRKKLLKDMAQEESRADTKLAEVQKKQLEQRKELNQRMHEAEQQSDSVITKLMQDGARLSDPARVMAAMEADRAAMEKQFIIEQADVEKLKATEVLRAMQAEMEAEIQRQATVRQYAERQGVVSQARASILRSDKAVEEALAAKGKQQEDIISKVTESTLSLSTFKLDQTQLTLRRSDAGG